MHAWIRRAVCAVGLTGGVVLIGIGLAEAASADAPSGPVTSGESGIVSGNQTGVDAKVPVNASGNQVTVIGQDNHVASTSSSSTHDSGPSSPTTTGESGVGSGNQTGVHVQAPVNISGNQVTVIGQDNKTDSSGTSTTGAGTSGASGSPTTSGESGIGSGNQTLLVLQVPVNASGNQVTVIGQDNTVDTTGSSSTGSSGNGEAAGGSPTTTGESGIVSGNQTGIVAQVPIDVSGNQVTVIGQDNEVHSTGASSTGDNGNGNGAVTSGEDGGGSGNQTGGEVQVPVNSSGNQVTVIGQDNTLESTGSTETGTTTGDTSGDQTNGSDGVGSGNQTPIGGQAPVNSSGNQVNVIAQGNTSSSSSTSTTGGGTTAPGPGSTVVVPPTTGGNAGTPTAASTPSAAGLPNTGLPSDTALLLLLGLLLLAAGGLTVRRGVVQAR